MLAGSSLTGLAPRKVSDSFDKSPTFSTHLRERRRMRRVDKTKHRKVLLCVEDATC